MRTLQGTLLIAAISIPSAAQKVGYVYCSPHENALLMTIVYSSPPAFIPVRRLNCGDKVEVQGRREFWLRIASTTGEQYVPMNALSERKNQFVAFNLPLPPEPRVIDRRTNTLIPQIISNPNAEYTEAALKAGVHGSVIIKLTVGKDRSVQDLKVLNGLGYGLDESAMKAVQSWKFKPALRDGIPVDYAVAVELDLPPQSH